MIKTFADPVTEALFHGVSGKVTRRLPVSLHGVMQRKLDMLDAAVTIDDLKSPPGNRLEKLRGDLAGFWSIRVNDQFRVVFEWKSGDAYQVQVVDYH